MRMVAVVGSRTYTGAEGLAVRLDWSRSFAANQERMDQVKALARRPRKGDAASVRFAMQAIEQRIVRGLWVLELSQDPDGPREQRRHGMQYMRDVTDTDWRYEDAPGGKWDAPPPRPAIPSNAEIEMAKEAKTWIDCLDPAQARLLNIASLSKRGDRRCNVNWEWVQSRLPELRGTKLRTMQDRYDQALRWIVAELTIRATEK